MNRDSRECVDETIALSAGPIQSEANGRGTERDEQHDDGAERCCPWMAEPGLRSKHHLHETEHRDEEDRGPRAAMPCRELVPRHEPQREQTEHRADETRDEHRTEDVVEQHDRERRVGVQRGVIDRDPGQPRDDRDDERPDAVERYDVGFFVAFDRGREPDAADESYR